MARVFKAKGFREVASHHRFFHFYANGKATSVFTKLSHGIAEYGDKLLSLVADQLRLSRKELEALLDCTMSAEEYAELLRNRGAICD